jgi:hypothetical protein
MVTLYETDAVIVKDGLVVLAGFATVERCRSFVGLDMDGRRVRGSADPRT